MQDKRIKEIKKSTKYKAFAQKNEQLINEVWSRQFKILRELENGQVYCQSNDDGSLVILNDWRKL